MRKAEKAFTLIELLIVVAIIAILAAIAVPNFLEAQTRAKISRVHSDMRTISLGIHAYLVDNNKTPYLYETYNAASPYIYNAYIYHHFSEDMGTASAGLWHNAIMLTTPVSYLDTIAYPDPFDVFGESHGSLDRAGYVCLSLQGALADGTLAEAWRNGSLSGENTLETYRLLSPRVFSVNGQDRTVTFLLVSPGPDKKFDEVSGKTMFPSHIIREDTNASAYVNGLVDLYDPTNGTSSGGELIRFE